MKDGLGTAVFTIVEVAALVIWLALVRSDAGIYEGSLSYLVSGLAVLAVGITV